MRRWIVLTVAILVFVGGLAAYGVYAMTGWYGEVSTLQPQLCVSRHSGSRCFTGATAAELAKVQVGDCVKVSFSSPTAAGPARLTAVTRASGFGHRADCPSGRRYHRRRGIFRVFRVFHRRR